MATPQEAMAQFEHLVLTLMSSDNVARPQAEAAYNSMKQQPVHLVSSLLHCARYSNKLEVRSLDRRR